MTTLCFILALLSAPELQGLAVDPGALSPQFSPARKAYIVHVGHDTETLTVSATADVSISFNRRPPAPIDLSPGRNLIEIEVGDTRYTLKAFRDYPTPTWVKVLDPAPFLPRDSAGELVFQNRLWLFGGYTPDVISSVWSSPDGLTWTRAGDIPCKAGVNIPVNAVHDGRMWVACNDGSLWSSPDGAQWSLSIDSAPWARRYAPGSAAFHGRLWVLGGIRDNVLYNDVWSSANGVDWTLETDRAPWSPRQLFSLVSVFDDQLWVIGGGITQYHPFKAYNDVWRSPDGRQWTRVTDNAPWPGRIWSSSAVYRNRLWLLGGFQSEPEWRNLNDVWYSPDGAQWYALQTPTTWSPRHELSAYVFDDKLWVVAGNEWPLKNDVWCLDIPGLTFLTQPPVEEFLGAEYTYRARADFNDSRQPVRYRLVEAPAWLTVDPSTGVLNGAPDALGDYPVTLEAYDDGGATARQSYTLHIIPLGG